MSEENPQSTVDLARRWKIELQLAKREDKEWIERAKKIVKRYRDDRNGAEGALTRYNILWSNVQTILPAVYAKKPKAEAERRNKDADSVARCAAEILERSLQYELDEYPDFDEAMRNAVLDRLLGGRGTVWVRFEQKEVPTAEDGQPMQGYVKECTPVDYVFWEDFRCSPARVWGEVTWVARRVYMSRDELRARFGASLEGRGKKVSDIPLSHVPIGLDDLKKEGAVNGETEAMKKAEVWECWDKIKKQVIWIAEGFDDTLDSADDPYGLDDFFPCPKPLYATQTGDTLVPVPDYTLYQDQARELDSLTTRIGRLVEACKVVGVYDASAPAIARMLNEGVDNTLIPVDQNWAGFAEKGGLKGVIDWLPLEQVIKALNECYMAREQCKQVIYEITGISDIIRGATEASETATAQNIKRQFGSLRLRPRQQDVAVFASEILRIKAQLMMDLYSPDSLVAISGIEATHDAQFIGPALSLMKQEPLRAYRVEVASDSLVEMDQEQEKQSRVEFLSAAGSFLRDALPMAQQVPESKQLLGEMLMFGIRAYKSGRELESVFEQFVQQISQPQPDKPDPEMAKIQAEQQQAQMKMQSDAQIAQMQAQTDAQVQQARAQADMEVQRIKIESQNALEQARTQMQIQLEQFKHESQLQHQFQLESQRMAFDRWKAELDAATKIEVANISAKSKMQDAATDTATKEIASEVTQ